VIATAVATLAIVAAVVGIARRARGSSSPPLGRARILVRVVLAGAVLANAIPHFLHGIAAADFPAPFARQLGPGLPNHVANIVWAVFNLGAGVNLARMLWGQPSKRAFAASLAAGFVAMSVFLALVFSR
jgi:hypothetical protein